MEINNDTIENFNFLDSTESDADFFSMGEPEEEEVKKPTVPPGEEAGEPTDNSEAEEEVEQEEDMFQTLEEQEEEEGEQEESEEEEEEEDAPTDEDAPTGDSISILNSLKKRGLASFELEEGAVLTEELAEEILEDSIDTMFEERLDDLFSKTPDILKEMNKFALKGGDINEFLDKIAVQNATGLTEGMDMEDEGNQEKVMRHGLKAEGYDEEYIDAQIEFLKDSKRLKSHSGTHYKKWETKKKEEQTQILKSQEERIETEKAQRRALKTKVSTFLSEAEEVEGFTISKEDVKELPNYMSDRVVKLDNGSQITNMQRDLMRVLNSPTGSVQIAKLLKTASETGELNFKDIETKSESKVAKKVRENVRRNKNSIISNSGKGRKTKKPLFKYFD